MSMMSSESRDRPKRRSIARKSEKRIRSAKKAARPELCKRENWEDWTKEGYADMDLYDTIQKVNIVIYCAVQNSEKIRFL